MSITKHPLYNIWNTIKNRCYNSKYSQFKNYGAKGIKMSDVWRYNFAKFVEDIGQRPSKKHQIDRIDNTGNYTLDNCRWSTSRENCRNKSTNKHIFYEGEKLLYCQWSEKLGLHRSTVGRRIKNGWTEKDAVTTPKNCNKDRFYIKQKFPTK